jgi:hypothetical protein
VRDEIKPLSRLINAMFNDIQSVSNGIDKYYASKFDHLNPRKENILNTGPSDFEVQGDFYLIKRSADGHMYIVFGDATGHFAYAGGLKLFIASKLLRVFDQQRGKKSRPLTAELIVKALDGEFQRVGRAALHANRRKPLEDGASMVVVRIHPTRKMAEYASAGIPVRTITLDGELKQYGGRPISLLFPSSLQRKRPLKPDVGSFTIDKTAFLAFVTDGFENLGRAKFKDVDQPDETMGQTAVEKALRGPFRRALPGDVTAADIAESVVRRARHWRKNHFIPESADDDRLVLVFDVRRLREETRKP